MRTYLQWLLVLCFCFITLSSGAEDKDAQAAPNTRYRCQLSMEYMHPKDYDRQIQTYSVNAFFWTKYFRKILLNIDVGLTLTYAWGNLLFHEDNPLKLITNTSAAGIGAIVKLQLTVLKVGNFSIDGMVSEGPILYSNRFPYGGSIYNFMFRAGPDFKYRIDNRYTMVLGYRFLHVSNAQKTEHRNPSYEARGFNIGFVRYL